MSTSVKAKIDLGIGLVAMGVPLLACAAASAEVAAPSAPVPVVTEVARREDVPVYRVGVGTVQAFNSVTVRTQVDGQLQQVVFTEGQAVKRGDLLAIVDPRPYEAALEQAQAKLKQDQARLANAQLTLSRYSKLAAESFTPQQTLDTQKAEVSELQALIAQDQAAIEDATTQLSYTRITSPLDGRTGLRLVDQGNIVHAADPRGIVVVNQIQPISVVSTLPSDALPDIRAGQAKGPVPATALDVTGRRVLAEGELTVVDNSIDPATSTVSLKSQFANADTALWPGQSVRLRVLVRIVRDVVTVASDAIQRSPSGEFVYAVQPGDTVRRRPVKVGQIAGGRAVVDEGVAAGDQIVVSGQYRLTEGSRVTSAGPQDPQRTARE